MKNACMGWLAAGVALVGGLAQAGVFVVEDGTARAEIVIAERPARMTKLAAKELQTHLAKMTGATLPITNRPGRDVPVQIYVGKSAYTDGLKLSTEGLAHGAFRMASGTNWLALLGSDQDFVPLEPWAHDRADMARALKEWDAQMGGTYGFPYARLYDAYNRDLDVWMMDDAGTMNAVCAFLRDLGVRWYFPGELGEVIPRQASVALPALGRVVTPDFPMRRFTYWYDKTENLLWNLRLGVNFGREMMGLTQNCHGSKYVYMRDEVKQAHPDWYAVWGGIRATNHSYCGAPCLSSEGLFDAHVAFARKMFDIRQEPMLSLDMCDGYGQLCLCDRCKDKGTLGRGWNGSLSDYVWGYVDRVARELYKSHPDRRVGGLSYSAYTLPPERIDALSPNLALVLCQQRVAFHDRALRERSLKVRSGWLERLTSKEMYVYDYYLQNCPRYMQADIPVIFPRLIAEDLRSLKGICKGDMIEVYLHNDPKEFAWDALAFMHLNIYVTSRLWWDAGQDLEAMLDEYYRLFYGPAGGAMKAFVEYAEANWPSMATSVEPIDKAFDLLTRARSAAGDTVYGRRVERLVACMEPLKARRARLAEGRKDAPVAVAVERGDTGLKVDGRLDEAFWQGVPVFELKELVSSNPPVHKTTFQVVWSGKSVIFGIRCADDDMANVNAWARQHDDPNIFRDDEIELLLETQTHAYYQIGINPGGFMIDLDRRNARDTLWSSQAEVAAHRGDTFWSVEIRIPTADLIEGGLDPLKKVEGTKPLPAAPWYFNVCRSRVRGKAVELSAFSPVGRNRFNDASKFGKLMVK